MASVHPGSEVIATRQERIFKQRRPAPRRYDVYAALPLDPRDPDVVRVKARLREVDPARGRTRP